MEIVIGILKAMIEAEEREDIKEDLIRYLEELDEVPISM